MARGDLLKQLFESYQNRDDKRFRAAAEEIIEEERKKHHPVLSNELQRILANGSRSLESADACSVGEPVPMDRERSSPLLLTRFPDRYFADLVLTDRTLETFQRILREIRGWEILEANGLRPSRRLLFCGPSGCGKTAAAEAISTELGLPLLYVRFDSVVSSLLGETAANLRKVFEYAKRGQWVVFFDEFDAIGRSRDDATEHGEIKRVVNSFLQLLDSFEGRSLLIAASNFEQVLDPAIWRRFDEVVRFDRPDQEALSRLLRLRLRPFQAEEEHLASLVEKLEGATFAEAERACYDVRKRCVLEGRKGLSDEDMAQAVERFRYRRAILQKASDTEELPRIDR
ncbi:MAG: ATP-binding protein [Candidatus Eremiobacteraeota bacterium]|nr:ATP-binding protein [Candidatus Eremiobacteraeota bacterium]